MKNTIIKPFGGKSEETKAKEQETVEISDSETLQAEQKQAVTEENFEDTVDGSVKEANIQEMETETKATPETKQTNVDTESLKFTNIFEPEAEETVESDDNSLIKEMKQFADTNEVSSSPGKDSIVKDAGVTSDDFPRETEPDKNEPDKNAGHLAESTGTDTKIDATINQVEADKKVDDLIDSLDTGNSQNTEQEPLSTAADVGQKDTAEDTHSDNIVYNDQTTYRTEAPADIPVTLTPSTADVVKESVSEETVPDSSEHLYESTVSDISGIEIDGTVFPADYFATDKVEQTVKDETLYTQALEPTPSQTSEFVASQSESSSDTTSDIQPTEPVLEQSEHTQQPAGTEAIAQSSTVEDMSTTTESEIDIKPSETVSWLSTSASEHSEIKVGETYQQEPPLTVQSSLAKPLVVHETVLKPSTTFNEWNTEDLEKYATPYKHEVIKPLNQGVDVNNRYTASVIQSSLASGSETVQEPLDITESKSMTESFAVLNTPDLSTVTLISDAVSLVTDVKENLTVLSDTVQDKVQPSLSQDPYKTADFASRKTLAADAASAEEVARTQNTGQQQEGDTLQGDHHLNIPAQDESQQVPVEEQDYQRQDDTSQHHTTTPKTESQFPPVTLRPKLDRDNNLDENNNYNIDPSLTTKVPDENLDEEIPKVTMLQRMEPQLKFVIDMVRFYFMYGKCSKNSKTLFHTFFD